MTRGDAVAIEELLGCPAARDVAHRKTLDVESSLAYGGGNGIADTARRVVIRTTPMTPLNRQTAVLMRLLLSERARGQQYSFGWGEMNVVWKWLHAEGTRTAGQPFAICGQRDLAATQT